jgi:hypothetical protein
MSADTEITETLSSKGVPPKRRIKDASSLIAIADKYDEQDQLSSFIRAKAQAMIDGESPWKERELKEKNLGNIVNTNFGEAKAILDAAMAPYIEMIDSVPLIANITLGLDDPQEAYDKSQIVSEEWDTMIREWDDYFHQVMQIQKGFVGDGISVAAFPDDRGIYFVPVFLKDFKIARDTPSSDQHIKIAVVKRAMDVAELFDYIKRPSVARELGWNVDAVREAIWKASPTSNKWKNSFSHWEEFERETKENDIYCSESGYERAILYYGYVREYAQSGDPAKYSQIIGSRDCSDLLYERFNKFDNINNCFVLFPYGIGSGTFHTIRGLKHDIYNHVQLSNRLLSTAVQGAMMSMQIILQGSAADIQNYRPIEMGPYSLLPTGINPIQITPPNVANSGLEMHGVMQRLIQNNTGSYQSREVSPDNQNERSATEVRAQMIQQNVLGSAAMTLFHTPYSKLHKEMFRRAISPILSQSDNGGKLAFNFRARCLKRGVTIDELRKVVSVNTVRSLGNGSAQLQQQAADELFQMSSAFDEVGRNAAIMEKAASIPGVGFRRVNAFVAKTGPRRSMDFDIANNENVGFMVGVAPVITSEQLHLSHLEAHLPFMANKIEEFKNGQINEEQAIQILAPMGEHSTEHVMALSQNMSMQREAAEMRKQLQNVMAFVDNLQQQVMNKMMAQQGQMEQQQEGGGLSPKEQYELEKMQLEIQKKQAEIEAGRQSHEQKMEMLRQQMALADAKTSSSIAATSVNPPGRPPLV